MELNRIQNALIAGEISWQDAAKQIPSLRKHWSSSEWKQRRQQKIGKCCENCGAEMSSMTIQHSSHPKPLSFLFEQELRKHKQEWKAWRENHPPTVDDSVLKPDVPGCPKCGSPTIRYRETLKSWICVSKIQGISCGNTFVSPVTVVSHAAISALHEAERAKIKEAFFDASGIGKRVVVRSLGQHISYLSMERVQTFCKRCAFVADRTNLVLCQDCKSEYHTPGARRCKQCSELLAKT